MSTLETLNKLRDTLERQAKAAANDAYAASVRHDIWVTAVNEVDKAIADAEREMQKGATDLQVRTAYSQS